MIIIEGPDAVGKTTLAHTLVKRINKLEGHTLPPARYAHLGILPSRWRFVDDYLPLLQRTSVQDRLYMSEIAYQVALDRPVRIDPIDYRFLDVRARGVGCVHVVVTCASDHDLRDRYAESLKHVSQAFDVSRVVAANDAYVSLLSGHLSHEYVPDVDVRIELRPGQWPDGWLDEVVKRWEARQLKLPKYGGDDED